MLTRAEVREPRSANRSATLERYVYGADGSCRAKDARSRVMAGEVLLIDYLADLAREPHFVSRQ